MKSGVRDVVAVDGAQLEYHYCPPLSAGRELPPIILLHPWFGCWQFWRQTVDALPEFATYAVDLYSLGASGDWQKFASPQGLAQAVAALLNALRIGRCSIIGNSMGGIAAQVMAAAQPDRIDRLILVGTGARIVGVKADFRQALDAWIAGEANREFTASLVDALLARRPEDPQEFTTFVDMVAKANKAFMGAVLTSAFDLDLRAADAQITAATLVIRGEHDAARTRTHVEELLAAIPRSNAVEIPAAGHSPQVDSPAAFSKLVRSFLLA